VDAVMVRLQSTLDLVDVPTWRQIYVSLQQPD
jgi:hypothetical protein